MSAIIFDLDGTLIDSLEDLADCVNTALKEKNYKPHTLEEYKYFIGNGAKILIQRALKDEDINENILEEIHNRFQNLYKEKIDSKTKVYQGIYDLLDNLEKQNIKKAILSNKPDIFTKECVKKFFPRYKFINISGQKKEIPKKPNAKAALNIAKELEVDKSNIYFIGDTKVDMLTAKNAGMIAIGVLWGFREEKELRENGADFIVEKPEEILDIIKKDSYIPIACHFYDEFESAAVKRVLSKIIYIDENKQKQEIKDYIKDLKNINKEEFVLLRNGLEIRLDKILSLNDKKAFEYKICNV